MALVTTTKASDTPVSIVEAREQCRVLDNSHDNRLAALIERATAYVETITGSRLMPQTVRLECDGFPSMSLQDGKLDLGVYPVRAITAAVYDDSGNSPNQTSITLATDYWQNLNGMYPFISPVTVWPTAYIGKPASVRITMSVGYATADDVPKDLKLAILKMVKEEFDHAGQTASMTIEDVANPLNALVAMHRRLPV